MDDDMGDTEPGTIQGAAWYGLVIMKLHPESHLARVLHVNTVAICYEQFVRKDRGVFVAWPFDVLDARPADGPARPPTFEPWVPYEAQMDIYDQLDGGCTGESQVHGYRQENRAWRSPNPKAHRVPSWLSTR